MKKFTAREMKCLIERIKILSSKEKDFHIRTHYNEILYHLKMINCFSFGSRYYSIKEQIEKGWVNEIL